MGFTQVDGKPFIYPDMVPLDYPFRSFAHPLRVCGGPGGIAV